MTIGAMRRPVPVLGLSLVALAIVAAGLLLARPIEGVNTSFERQPMSTPTVPNPCPDIGPFLSSYTFEAEQGALPGVIIQEWLNNQINGLSNIARAERLSQLNRQFAEAQNGNCEGARPSESLILLAKIMTESMMSP